MPGLQALEEGPGGDHPLPAEEFWDNLSVNRGNGWAIALTWGCLLNHRVGLQHSPRERVHPRSLGASPPRTGSTRFGAATGQSKTFSIRTRRPSTVSYHSCCFRACLLLLIRCWITAPVAVSTSTNLDMPIFPRRMSCGARGLRWFPFSG